MMLKGHKQRYICITKGYFLSMDSVEFKAQLAQFAMNPILKKKMVKQTPRSHIEEIVYKWNFQTWNFQGCSRKSHA